MTNLQTRWPDIQRLASSHDDFERTTSLAIAVGSLEVALTALGIARDPRQGFLRRLELSGILSRAPGAPSLAEIRTATNARNSAVHNHAVPDRKQCTAHVKTLENGWAAFRRLYVTRKTAATLARHLLDFDVISDVFLFGSLARGHSDPVDIDLLLYDDGDLSSISSHYGDSTFFVREMMLDDIFFGDEAVRAALRLGWLDYILIDGTRFGEDKKYTLSLAQAQRDSLFFVKMSDALLRYDRKGDRWVKARPKVFQRLATIKAQLVTENIIRR